MSICIIKIFQIVLDTRSIYIYVFGCDVEITDYKLSTANTHTFLTARGEVPSPPAKAKVYSAKRDFAFLFVNCSLLSISATPSISAHNIISLSDLLIILSTLISGILILNLIIS